MARSCEQCGPRICVVCGVERPAVDFYVRKNRQGEHGHRRDCGECCRASRREHYETHKDAWRAASFRRLYGITLDGYDAMYDTQGGACAICGDSYPRRGIRGNDVLHVDHDHATGVVRGLICHGCNTGIGGFRDDPQRLLAAAAWLVLQADRVVV